VCAHREDKSHDKVLLVAGDQPGLAGLIVSSLRRGTDYSPRRLRDTPTWEAFLVGIGGVNVRGNFDGIQEALSDDGSLTGAGSPGIRGEPRSCDKRLAEWGTHFLLIKTSE